MIPIFWKRVREFHHITMGCLDNDCFYSISERSFLVDDSKVNFLTMFSLARLPISRLSGLSARSISILDRISLWSLGFTTYPVTSSRTTSGGPPYLVTIEGFDNNPAST